MPEPRSPVMILVEASWEDPSGSWHTARACMMNRSVSGTCIRIKKPIAVGCRLTIQWRWEEFSGVTKYCRHNETDYLIGIKRDTQDMAIRASTPGTAVPVREDGKGTVPHAVPAKLQTPPKRQENKSIEPSVSMRKAEVLPSEQLSNLVATIAALRIGREAAARDSGRIRRPQEFAALRSKELQVLQPPMEKEARKEKKLMARKWLGLGNWGDKQEEVNPSSNAISETVEPPKPAPEVSPPPRVTSLVVTTEEEAPSLRDELLGLEDIYRTAGIVTPRKGYNITKVVEMLHSEHMRGLAKDLKRASILMALDAAGIATETILDDAKARLEAINSYEAAQRRQFEAEWARRAEENVQIQSELESLKARYTDRLKRNQDGIAREKATFGSWLTVKQRESQNILEAVELCLKPVAPEPVSTSLPAVTVADAVHKSV